VAFAIYAIAGVAEANRAPFDLPEAEGELGAGFHTEYSGFKWSMFFMAEYVNMVNVSALAVVLFLGGWWPAVDALGPFSGVVGPLIFIAKLAIFIFGFIWLRSTFPRLRFDRLMKLGWLVLLPIALINLVVTAVVVALWPVGAWPFA
jgi:NADH-quinone oxidoreductase subunit H